MKNDCNYTWYEKANVLVVEQEEGEEGPSLKNFTFSALKEIFHDCKGGDFKAIVCRDSEMTYDAVVIVPPGQCSFEALSKLLANDAEVVVPSEPGSEGVFFVALNETSAAKAVEKVLSRPELHMQKPKRTAFASRMMS